jgi:hypothetical protein
MIDVPDRANVYVRLAAIKFLFRHEYDSLLPTCRTLLRLSPGRLPRFQRSFLPAVCNYQNRLPA